MRVAVEQECEVIWAAGDGGAWGAIDWVCG
jgi:hypothetical protein